MDTIVIRAKPYVGEYPFDTDERTFSIQEWRWIKKIAGYMPLTIGEGWAGRDPDLVLVFAVIALVRAGKVTAEQALLAAGRLETTEFDGVAISFESDSDEVEDSEDDADPPSEASLTTSATPNTGTSGKPTLASSESLPDRIGAPA